MTFVSGHHLYNRKSMLMRFTKLIHLNARAAPAIYQCVCWGVARPARRIRRAEFLIPDQRVLDPQGHRIKFRCATEEVIRVL